MTSALKNKKKIETLFDKGFAIKAKGLLLKGYDFKDGETKFGISVSKKNFPTAVKRNLVKRRIREQVKNLGFLGLMSKGVSFFIIYTSKQLLSSKEIRESFKELGRKI